MEQSHARERRARTPNPGPEFSGRETSWGEQAKRPMDKKWGCQAKRPMDKK
ncbi:MAG: hypothetical protein RBU37_17930 [Myxococcota bacterium]|nr:hypothetical protein [Myxococcota bacterium]